MIEMSQVTNAFFISAIFLFTLSIAKLLFNIAGFANVTLILNLSDSAKKIDLFKDVFIKKAHCSDEEMKNSFQRTLMDRFNKGFWNPATEAITAMVILVIVWWAAGVDSGTQSILIALIAIMIFSFSISIFIYFKFILKNWSVKIMEVVEEVSRNK